SKISAKIKDAVAFAKGVKEIETLVKSIDELAKGIKKKIGAAGLVDDNNGNDKNNALMAGAYSVSLDIVGKSKALQIPEYIKDQGVTDKVTGISSAAEAFVNKLKEKNNVLGVDQGAATDDNVKKAIDRNTHPNGENGSKELQALNTAIDALLTSANGAVEAAIAEFATPAKPAAPVKS
ncbi:Vsp/OspC family lipoprotein, partial [Borrelia hermsii]